MKKIAAMLLMCMMIGVAGCGGGGGGGTPQTEQPVATDLRAVFYRTLTNAPLLTVNLFRQNGTPISGCTVSLDTRIDATGNQVVGNVMARATDTNGSAYFAVPANTYALYVSAPATTVPIGAFNDSITISADAAKTYQTSQQNWIVTSSKAFTRLQVAIYQTDANGAINWGTAKRPLNPLALTFSTPTSTGQTSVQFTTELFKGYYRAVITSTPSSTTDVIAPYITRASAVVAASGNGGADTLPTISLDQTGNLLSLTLYDASSRITNTTAKYLVTAYDKTSLLPIGSSYNDDQAVASIATGGITDVVAVVTNMSRGGVVEAIKAYTASISSNEKLTQYAVSGTIVPPSGGVLDATDGTMGVTAKIASGLGDYFDKTLAGSVSCSVNSVGVFQNLKLFEGNYTLQANIKKFPESSRLSIIVSSGPLSGQDISVKAGGIITGRVQDQARNDLAGVAISVLDATTNELVSSTTSTTLGAYSLAVPSGTYNLFANGAVTRNITVDTSANNTVTKNLTQYTVQGRLTDSLGTGIAGTVSWGGGSAIAGSLGTYTIKMMEGENWVWFAPPSTLPSLGFGYESAVQIDATTISTN